MLIRRGLNHARPKDKHPGCTKLGHNRFDPPLKELHIPEHYVMLVHHCLWKVFRALKNVECLRNTLFSIMVDYQIILFSSLIGFKKSFTGDKKCTWYATIQLTLEWQCGALSCDHRSIKRPKTLS